LSPGGTAEVGDRRRFERRHFAILRPHDAAQMSTYIRGGSMTHKTDPAKLGVQTAGAAYLAAKAHVTHPLANRFRNVLVVDDDALGLRYTSAVVVRVLSSSAKVRTAKTLSATLDALIANPTIDLILLNDHLKPTDTALSTLPYIRRIYSGPIVVNSAKRDALRVQEMLRLGAAAFIHLDTLDSRTLSEALGMAAAWKPPA
jgi:CheY-like chemotaxis protein